METVLKTETVEGEIGIVIDYSPGETHAVTVLQAAVGMVHEERNTGVEYFKIKSPDMLGNAQWTIQRNKRSVRVRVLHQSWLDDYHQRKFALLPGDSLKCRFEEHVMYDQSGTEIERQLSIIEVLDIITPPVQRALL